MIDNERTQLVELIEKVAIYGTTARYEDQVEQAWDFIGGIFDQDGLSEEMQERVLGGFLIPWLLFHWVPERYDADKLISQEPVKQPIAFHYLKENAHTLSDAQQAILTKILASHYSYYQVVELPPGDQAIFLDLLLGTRHALPQSYTGQPFELGAIIFGCIVPMSDKSSELVWGAPYNLAADQKTILSIRDYLAHQYGELTPASLRNACAMELIGSLFLLIDDGTLTAHEQPRHGKAQQNCCSHEH